MKNLLSILFFFLLSLHVQAEILECEVIANHERLSVNTIEIKGQYSIPYAKHGSYSFFVKTSPINQYEIEIYNSNGPIRNYVVGKLERPTDKLAWTLWSRDILLETNCKLAEEL